MYCILYLFVVRLQIDRHNILFTLRIFHRLWLYCDYHQSVANAFVALNMFRDFVVHHKGDPISTIFSTIDIQRMVQCFKVSCRPKKRSTIFSFPVSINPLMFQLFSQSNSRITSSPFHMWSAISTCPVGLNTRLHFF